MAKKSVASLQTGSKRLSKAIKMVKSPKTGAYMFVESIMAPELVKDFLNKQKQPLEDLGCFSLDAVDYPDYAKLLSDKLKNDLNSQGILFCALV